MIPVQPKHHPGRAETNVHTLIPESCTVVFDQEWSKGVADLVGVVGVGYIEAE